MVDQDGVALQAMDRPAVRENSRLQVSRCHYADQNYVAGNGNFLCILSQRYAVLVSKIIFCGIYIEACDSITCSDQTLGRALAHEAETDEADGRFVVAHVSSPISCPARRSKVFSTLMASLSPSPPAMVAL